MEEITKNKCNFHLTVNEKKIITRKKTHLINHAALINKKPSEMFKNANKTNKLKLQKYKD